MAEKDSPSSQADNKQPQKCSKPANEDRKGGRKDLSPSLCTKYGAAVWHESRKTWLGVGGDQTQRSEEVLKYPIICWSTSYEDPLLTNEQFSEPIPLVEMVDVWHMEGLFD